MMTEASRTRAATGVSRALSGWLIVRISGPLLEAQEVADDESAGPPPASSRRASFSQWESSVAQRGDGQRGATGAGKRFALFSRVTTVRRLW